MSQTALTASVAPLNKNDNYECEVCGKCFSLAKRKNEHMKKHSSNWQICKCPVPGCTKSYVEIKNWRKHFRLKHIDKNDDDTARKNLMKTFEERIIMADSASSTSNALHPLHPHDESEESLSPETPEPLPQMISNAPHPHDESDESLFPKIPVKEVSSIAPVANRANRSFKKKDLQIENARLLLIIRKLLRIKMSKGLVNRAIRPKRLTYKTIGLKIEPVEPVTRKCSKIPVVPPPHSSPLSPIKPKTAHQVHDLRSILEVKRVGGDLRCVLEKRRKTGNGNKTGSMMPNRVNRSLWPNTSGYGNTVTQVRNKLFTFYFLFFFCIKYNFFFIFTFF